MYGYFFQFEFYKTELITIYKLMPYTNELVELINPVWIKFKETAM